MEHCYMLEHMSMSLASLYQFWVSVQYPLSEALCFDLGVFSLAAK
jgi:hypothetical protein